MSIQTLKTRCKARGIKGYSRMPRHQLIQMLDLDDRFALDEKNLTVPGLKRYLMAHHIAIPKRCVRSTLVALFPLTKSGTPKQSDVESVEYWLPPEMWYYHVLPHLDDEDIRTMALVNQNFGEWTLSRRQFDYEVQSILKKKRFWDTPYTYNHFAKQLEILNSAPWMWDLMPPSFRIGLEKSATDYEKTKDHDKWVCDKEYSLTVDHVVAVLERDVRLWNRVPEKFKTNERVQLAVVSRKTSDGVYNGIVNPSLEVTLRAIDHNHSILYGQKVSDIQYEHIQMALQSTLRRNVYKFANMQSILSMATPEMRAGVKQLTASDWTSLVGKSRSIDTEKSRPIVIPLSEKVPDFMAVLAMVLETFADSDADSFAKRYKYRLEGKKIRQL